MDAARVMTRTAEKSTKYVCFLHFELSHTNTRISGLFLFSVALDGEFSATYSGYE